MASQVTNQARHVTVILVLIQILDDVTLTNLDIVASLLEKLDSTSTAFGKRLLRQWVCSPLTSIVALKARQGAVQGLLNNPALMAEAKSFLRKIPDLERLLHK